LVSYAHLIQNLEKGSKTHYFRSKRLNPEDETKEELDNTLFNLWKEGPRLLKYVLKEGSQIYLKL
jgi:hypothetical protein